MPLQPSTCARPRRPGLNLIEEAVGVASGSAERKPFMNTVCVPMVLGRSAVGFCVCKMPAGSQHAGL
eukprot:3317653-Karenia_brevis.AAC.1